MLGPVPLLAQTLSNPRGCPSTWAGLGGCPGGQRPSHSSSCLPSTGQQSPCLQRADQRFTLLVLLPAWDWEPGQGGACKPGPNPAPGGCEGAPRGWWAAGTHRPLLLVGAGARLWWGTVLVTLGQRSLRGAAVPAVPLRVLWVPWRVLISLCCQGACGGQPCRCHCSSLPSPPGGNKSQLALGMCQGGEGGSRGNAVLGGAQGQCPH